MSSVRDSAPLASASKNCLKHDLIRLRAELHFYLKIRYNQLINLCQVVKTRQAIMFFYVYVLQSEKDNSLYIGFSSDLRKRLKEHNRGLNFSTKSHRPWNLIHYEAYLSQSDAKRRESYLKTSQGSRLFKRMLKDYFYSKLKN